MGSVNLDVSLTVGGSSGSKVGGDAVGGKLIVVESLGEVEDVIWAEVELVVDDEGDEEGLRVWE